MDNEKEQEIKQELEETEILDFNNPSFKFVPNGRHTYRQEGGYLVCRTCILKHAVWIGMEKIMVGENEKGDPILKKRS
jgi:hypothetical protein